MALNPTSQAAAVGASVKNVQFSPEAQVLPRKVVVIGTYDPLITTITNNVPALVTSPEDAAVKYGAGYMIHRLVLNAYKGSDGVETWVIPQAEAGGATAASGEIDATGSTASESGTIYLYVSGDLVTVNVTKGDTATEIADAIKAAIDAESNLSVSAGTVALDAVPVDVKSKGPWGDEVTLSLNEGFGQELPGGVTLAITQPTGGAGVPDIQDALDGMGTGDDSNEDYFTELAHGYLQDSTTLDAISVYNGEGNDAQGCYAKTVARPFRSLVGDVVVGSGGLSALVSLADGRKEDRTNGVIAVPGSPNHPAEIAAIALGVMAKTNLTRAEENYNGKTLPSVIPGARADRWTSSYDSRDTAVKNGVSPTIIESGAVKMTNALTFYRPDDVPTTSNGYKSQRNISILQNVLFNIKLNFSQEKWQGITIVDDLSKVTNAVSKEKARDTSTVTSDLITLAEQFEGLAWIFTASFTVDRLKEGLVTVRAGGSGFDATFPIILSGDAVIIDVVTQFDTSLVALQG